MGIKKLQSFLFTPTSAAPLVVFRIVFGIMMFVSLVRFVANGWVDALYVQPKFFFTFYGFEWIRPLGAEGMYGVFGAMMLASLFIAAGFLYRFSAMVFFLLFSYVELIDKTNYLNHYYFISIISLLMCFLPSSKSTGLGRMVPRWAIFTLQLQMAIVYFFAGIAKINSDWLLHAMPLKVWLPTRTDIPFGSFLDETFVAYLFSWCGILFDVSIAFFLFNRKTVWYAYAVVIFFHALTAILFPGIGMFPFIMIVCAGIFLPYEFHERILRTFKFKLSPVTDFQPISNSLFQYLLVSVLALHFLVQFVLPFRYALYPNKLFYTEQGYRFSWRVMLMEKAGLVFFYVKDKAGNLREINNRDFLTAQQEKQMSTQPDMILQFAQFLKEQFNTKEVYAEAYVSVNGKGSTLFLDPKVNLAALQDGFSDKKWILAANR